tara:strand:+ start:243 stop:914 length:672 start_codon:yes stop_codon:yes gene_type:complete
MYSQTRQSGKTRVNKVVDGKVLKSRHKKTQPKKDRSTPLTKLYAVQNDLFKEGYTLKEYENYIQEKINKDMFYYTRVTESDIQKLKERYAIMIKKEDQYYNEFEDTREMKQKQRKLFREKKKNILHEKKQELIHTCMKEFIKTSSAQVFNRSQTKLSDEVIKSAYQLDNWDHTRNLLFGIGGTYLLDTDRTWAKFYDLLVSEPSFKLVGCTNNKELNKFVFEN